MWKTHTESTWATQKWILAHAYKIWLIQFSLRSTWVVDTDPASAMHLNQILSMIVYLNFRKPTFLTPASLNGLKSAPLLNQETYFLWRSAIQFLHGQGQMSTLYLHNCLLSMQTKNFKICWNFFRTESVTWRYDT